MFEIASFLKERKLHFYLKIDQNTVIQKRLTFDSKVVTFGTKMSIRSKISVLISKSIFVRKLTISMPDMTWGLCMFFLSKYFENIFC